jgi:hypothetical protein
MYTLLALSNCTPTGEYKLEEVAVPPSFDAEPVPVPAMVEIRLFPKLIN